MEDKTERMPNASETEAIPRSHESDGEATEAGKGMDTNQGGESSPEGFSEPSFSNKRRKFIPIIAGAAAVLLIAGGTAFALNQPTAVDQAPQAVEDVVPAADSDEPVKETYRIYNTNGAAGLDPETEADYCGGTPIIVHIKGTSDEVKDVDFYKAVERDSGKQEFELVKGDYDVTYIDSITPRGGIASMAKSSSPTGWFGNSKNYGNYSHAVTIAPGYIAPEDVTQEQIDDIMDQLKDAVAKGDETLAGEKGQAVIDAAASNAAANPNIDKDKVAEKADEAKQNVSDTPASTTGGSNEQSSNSNASGSTASAGGNSSSSSNSGSSGSSGNSTSETDPTPAPAPDPTPALTPQKVWVDEVGHWEPVYEQQWVPNVVVVTPEQTVDVIIFSDGYRAYSWAEQNEYSKKTGLSYSFSTETHPAVTEDRGSYQNVQVGQNWVVDVPGHWA